MLSKRFPAFKSRDFKIFWITGLISNTGTEMQFVAINWQVYILTHSALMLGLIGLFRFVPVLIFSLLGGLASDVYNRKKIQYVTLTGYMIVSLVLTIADFTNTINVPIIFVATFFSSAFFAFDLPARQGLLPNLVDRKYLTSAFSLNGVMFQSAKIFGPTIAGLLIAKTHLYIIYGLNFTSFIFIISGLIFIKTTGEIVGKNSNISLAALKEGFSFVRHRTMIWSTMALDFFSTFFSSAEALIPIFALTVLNVGPTGLGLLYAAASVGSVIAGVTVAHYHSLSNQGKILLTALGFYATGTIVFGLSKVFAISFIALMVVGASDTISAVIRNTIRQVETPDYIRGRMTSINMIFFMGGPQLGDFEAGALASSVGAPFSVIIGGGATLLIALACAKFIPMLRNYDQPRRV